MDKVIGTKPAGKATGRERWATIRQTDSLILITAFSGWAITDEVRLSGRVARTLAEDVANNLITTQYEVTEDGDGEPFVTAVAPIVLEQPNEPVITSEPVDSTRLRYGKTYLTKVDGKTVGILIYTGRIGSKSTWNLCNEKGECLTRGYAGSRKDAAAKNAVVVGAAV